MATIRFSSCGSCGKGLGGRDAWPDIGAPYIKCPRCGTLNKTNDGTTEWEFMDWGARLVIIFKYGLFGIAFGFLPIVVAALVAQAMGIDVSDWEIFPLIAWSVPLGLLFTWLLVRHAVAGSRKRLTDARYRSIVERMMAR